MGPTGGPALAWHEEQQGPEERKETIRSGEPMELTPWAAASGGEQKTAQENLEEDRRQSERVVEDHSSKGWGQGLDQLENSGRGKEP